MTKEIDNLKKQIKSEGDPNVKKAFQEKLAQLEGKKVDDSEYLDTGMSAGEYEEAKTSSGKAGFPVEGVWPLVLGKPYADTVSRADNSESWDVIKFLWATDDDPATPFVSEGEFTAFKTVNPNTGKSPVKNTLVCAGVNIVEKDGNILFKPSEVEGKLVRGYFKIQVNPDTGKKEYFDPALGEYRESRIANLVTFLPLEDEASPAAESDDLPF